MADRKTGDGRNFCEVHYINDSSEEEPEDKNLWPSHLAQRWIFVFFVGTCLLYCSRMAMPICAVTMATTFHWSKIDSGLVLGGFFWGYCFTQILGGHASDKVGGERVLLVSAASWGLLTFVTPLLAKLGSHTFALMTLVRFVMGLLQGVFFPSLASLCSHRVVDGERGFVMSTMSSGSYLGTLIAGGMGSLMLDLYGWESLFYTIGLLSGLWAIIVWLFFLKGDVSIKQVQSKSDSEWSLSKTRWLSLFKEPPVWAMVFAHMCICSTSNTLLSWLPTYFKESFPHAEGLAGNVIPWLVAIPSALCGGYFSDFLINQGYGTAIVRKLMQFFAMGLSSLLLTPLPGGVSYFSAVILVSASVGLATFSGGGVSVNVQDLTPSCAGALYGFMNMLGAFGGLLLISVSGYLIEVTQSWAWVFSLIILVNTSGLVVFLILGDARRVDTEVYSRVNEL